MKSGAALHLRYLVAVWSLLSMAGDSAAAAPANPQNDAKAPKRGFTSPMALVVATGNYKATGLTRLEDTVGYAIELAQQLKKIGCDVRFATDAESAEGAKAKLGNTINVVAVNDGKSLAELTGNWLKEVAAKQSPIAYLVMSGHGEERLESLPNDANKRRVAYYLCRDDSPGDDGLSIDTVNDMATQAPGVKLVVIYNACRELAKREKLNIKGAENAPDALPKVSPDEGPNESSHGEEKPPQMRISRAKAIKQGIPPTILFATQSGKVAFAKQDLVWSLAKALKYDNEVRQFLAYTHPEIQGRQPDLSLYFWFYYGLAGQLKVHGLRQAHEIIIGSVPLDAIVAKVNGGQLAAPKVQNLPINLAEIFRPSSGDFKSNFEPRLGWSIAKTAGMITQNWAGGLVADDDGFEVTGKFLELDLIAYYQPKGNLERAADRNLAFEVHPKFQGKATKDTVHLSDDRFVYRIPFNRPLTISIPLKTVPDGPNNPPVKMNGLGFAAPRSQLNDWPEGATLAISNLKLVPQTPDDQSTAIKIEPAKKVDLLWRWNAADLDAANPLVAERDPQLKERYLRLILDGDKRFGRLGGDLFPMVYVPKASVLDVEVTNLDTQLPSELSVSLLYLTHEGEKTTKISFADLAGVKTPPGRTVKTTIKLAEEGFANYFAVAASSKSIRLKSVGVRTDPSTIKDKN